MDLNDDTRREGGRSPRGRETALGEISAGRCDASRNEAQKAQEGLRTKAAWSAPRRGVDRTCGCEGAGGLSRRIRASRFRSER